MLRDVAGDAGERERGGRHHLVDARRGREQAGEVADRELDPVENLRQGRQLAQLGQSAERLHATDDGVERLAVAGRDLERARRPIERARDQRALPGDERAHARR